MTIRLASRTIGATLAFFAISSAMPRPPDLTRGIEPFEPRNLIRTEAPAFPYWEDIAFCGDVPQELKDAALPMFATAMNLVIRTPPPEDNLFYWHGSREPLQDKTFKIRLCTSRSRKFTDLLSMATSPMDRFSKTTIAATAFLSLDGTDRKQIVVFLLLDRVLLGERKHLPENGFAVMVFGLAAELYGGVSNLARLDYDSLPHIDSADGQARAVERERHIVQASFGFIDRLIATDGPLAKLPTPTRERLREEFSRLAEKQRPHLDRWLQDLEKRSKGRH